MNGLDTAEIVLLLAAGFGGGAVNAVAGGGSLIGFPALLAVGYPSVTANVTNSIAMLPGYLGSSLGYRRELAGQRERVTALAATSGAGALAGSVLLLVSSEALFDAIVPFLILFACALLAAQPTLSRVVRPADRLHAKRLHLMLFAAATYGGYFGAGLGIMLLALLALSLDDDLQRLNALKGPLSFLIGLVAAVCFAAFGPVKWSAAGLMAVAAFGGAQVGAVLARRLPAAVLRAVVIGFGVVVAVVLLVD